MPAPIHPPAQPETVLTDGAPQLKSGSGAADEIGADLAPTGARRAIGIPEGIGAVGYTEDDVAGILRRSLSLW